MATSVGTLFIRSFERGERVYIAMVARGYDGTIPEFDDVEAGPRQWASAATLPALGTLVAVLAVTVGR